MRQRYPLVITVVLTAIAYLFAGNIPAAAAFVLGMLVTAALAFEWSPLAFLGEESFSRTKAGISAASLTTLGLTFTSVLIGDFANNDYFWIAIIGNTLILLGTLFALAMMPVGRLQRPLYLFGIGALWVLGLVAPALLLIGMIALFFQETSSGQAMLSHIGALLLLLPSVYMLGYWLPRWRSQDPPEAA